LTLWRTRRINTIEFPDLPMTANINIQRRTGASILAKPAEDARLRR
jgi:hypothetical protein